MDIKGLKQGDILLFSPEKGSFISWAITFLTNAPVSHAAMYYNEENQSIIEETPPQVKVNSALERFKDREIYIRRLIAQEDLPLHPVINAATGYLNDAEPYDNSGLYLVGLLLIYKKFTPSNKVQKAVVKILKKLASSIMQYIHKHQDPGKLPMVCSQFVAQCYDVAGDKYKLKIENGVLQKMAAAHDGNNLLDQAMEIVKSGKRTNLKTLSAPASQIQFEPSSSGEELCRELKEAFNATADERAADISDELLEAVYQFAHAHHVVSSGETRLQRVLQDDGAKVFQNLKDYENMFVAPGDLFNHCKNLKVVGTIP